MQRPWGRGKPPGRVGSCSWGRGGGVGLGRFLASLSTPTFLVICPFRLPLRLCTPLNAGWQRFLGMRLYLDTTLLSVGLEHTVSF